MHRYWQLTKPKVVAAILFTALVGMLLATPAWPRFDLLVFGCAGIWLAAASAAALNHVLDARLDVAMMRTRWRPLPSGQLTGCSAVAFASCLAVASMLVLALGVNLLAATLTLASLIGYSVVYTVWLKHTTPQNIVIGGAAGAAPPVLEGRKSLWRQQHALVGGTIPLTPQQLVRGVELEWGGFFHFRYAALKCSHSPQPKVRRRIAA